MMILIKTFLPCLLILLAASTLWGANGRVDKLRQDFLPSEANYEASLSKESHVTLKHRNPETNKDETATWKKNEDVFTFTQDFETVKNSIKGVRFTEWDKGKAIAKRDAAKKLREANPAMKNNTGAASVNSIENLVTQVLDVPNYRMATGRAEDGRVVILTSHRYDPATRSYVPKTTIRFISPPEFVQQETDAQPVPSTATPAAATPAPADSTSATPTPAVTPVPNTVAPVATPAVAAPTKPMPSVTTPTAPVSTTPVSKAATPPAPAPAKPVPAKPVPTGGPKGGTK